MRKTMIEALWFMIGGAILIGMIIYINLIRAPRED